VSAFIDQQRAAGFAVELTCRSIGTSPSAYYQRATGDLSTRAREDERLLAQIRRVYRANYEAYGSLRVWKALKREGIVVGRGRVERLMAQDGLVGAKRRGRAWKTTVADPAGCERPDLVNRDFSATRPDALWIADFTYLKSWEGVGFFSFVLDVYSRRCVGWQLSSNMRTDLVLDALKMALGTRRHGADLELVHHSDRGSQYTSFDFTQALADNDVLGSLGSTGDAYDNAMAESFVDSFKTELIRDRVFKTRTQLALAIVEWVGWYNHDRLHSAIGYVPPAEHEALYARQDDASPSLTMSGDPK
jgi:putative transposase